MSSRDERRRGCLLGLAVGDALGTTNEFKQLEAPPYPELAAGPLREVVGGGPFHVAPGQVTDDTQMACCLAASLREHGEFRVDNVARRYAEWMPHAFDIGGQTSACLSLVAHGAPGVEAGRRIWEQRGRSAAGNGSLMRTAPIGVFFAGDDDSRRRASLLDSAITHFDPRCQLACAAFNAAIAYAVQGEQPAVCEDMAATAEQELPLAADLCRRIWPGCETEIATAEEQLREDLAAVRQARPGLYSSELHIHKHQGFVRVAFRLAFWHLHHGPDFETSLIDVANRGGDADTNAAIAGALLGARDGEQAIPQRWRDTVLGALEGETGRLANEYHPRELLRLA